ncbi:MAG: sulfatase [Candidatus Nanohaloarchaea archaeon]|nr:sulfatase [Candidatus Nanohaloarchaea archaeon]
MRPNILLIVVDSVPYDSFGYAGERDTTPNIDELAGEGATFTNAFAAGTWTPASHAPLFAGKLASETDSLSPSPELNAGTTLAAELQKEGYETLGVSTATHITRDAGYAQGFDAYIQVHPDFSRYSLDPTMMLDTLLNRIWGRRDRTLYQTHRIKNKIEAAERPFFLFANIQNAHRPYRPPFWLRRRFEEGGGDREKVTRLMDMSGQEIGDEYLDGDLELTEEEWRMMRSWHRAELYRSDFYIGRIIQQLKQMGEYENTVIIVTSDHGDEFGEHGGFAHGYMYDTNIHVPLVIAGPGVPSAEYDGLVSHMDVAPTLLSLAEIDVPEVMDGTPILPLNEFRRDYIIAERGGSEPIGDSLIRRKKSCAAVAVRTERYKLIRRYGMENELYDIESDTGETQNIIDSHPDIAENLASKSSALTVDGRQDEEEYADADAETKQRLKELGYL